MAALLFADHRSNREGDQRFGSGLDLHPAVGLGARQRNVRANVDEAAPLLALVSVHVREAPRLLDGVAPRFQKIAAEVEQQFRFLKVQFRKVVAAKGKAVGLTLGVLVQQAELDAATSAHGLQPLVQKAAFAPGGGLAKVHDLAVGAAELVDELLECLIPRGRLAALAAPASGVRHALRVVEVLHRGLPPCAQRPVVEGMLRVALRLLRPVFPHRHHHAAARLALAAGGHVLVRRLRGVLEVVGWNQQGDQLFGLLLAACGNGSGPTESHVLEQVSSAQPFLHPYLLDFPGVLVSSGK